MKERHLNLLPGAVRVILAIAAVSWPTSRTTGADVANDGAAKKPTTPAAKKPVLEEEYKALKYKSMPYRLLIPKGYEKSKHYPLVLFLHGYGERGTDNVKQLKYDIRTPKYTEYPGLGHGPAITKAYTESELLPWLFKQKRK